MDGFNRNFTELNREWSSAMFAKREMMNQPSLGWVSRLLNAFADFASAREKKHIFQSHHYWLISPFSLLSFSKWYPSLDLDCVFFPMFPYGFSFWNGDSVTTQKGRHQRWSSSLPPGQFADPLAGGVMWGRRRLGFSWVVAPLDTQVAWVNREVTICLFHIAMENPPIFKNGKPSMSMGHLYHGELLVITRGYIL